MLCFVQHLSPDLRGGWGISDSFLSLPCSDRSRHPTPGSGCPRERGERASPRGAFLPPLPALPSPPDPWGRVSCRTPSPPPEFWSLPSSRGPCPKPEGGEEQAAPKRCPSCGGPGPGGSGPAGPPFPSGQPGCPPSRLSRRQHHRPGKEGGKYFMLHFPFKNKKGGGGGKKKKKKD